MIPKKLLGQNIITYIITFAFMAAFCAVAFVFDVKAGIFSVALFVCYIIYTLIYYFFGMRDTRLTSEAYTLQENVFGFLSHIHSPVLVCSDEGQILWFNPAFRFLYPTSVFKSGDDCKNIGNDLISVTSFQNTASGDTNEMKMKIGSSDYKVTVYHTDYLRKGFYFAIWTDITDFVALSEEHLKSNVLVAYAMVDNISEVTQGTLDEHRQVAAQIANALTGWVASMNGIIKEYERDKYIILFEERYLDAQIENNFDILEKISSFSESGNDSPITVSFGIARVDGSLTEKEETAKLSLRLALQRGGAQVVVKTKTDNDFFGGKTKSVQKTTSIKARVYASTLANLIKNASNVLVMTHKNPDFDAVASSVAIARLAMYNGKSVKVVSDMGNRNFKTCLQMLNGIDDYETVFVDKEYGLELLKPDTLLVITDVSNERIFESPEIYGNADNIIVIDHHRQTAEFEKTHLFTYIEPSASSATELICEMLEFVLPANVLYKEEAELMLSGILLDTQNFSRNVGVRTFASAVYLRECGANTGKSFAMFKYQYSEFKKLAEFEKNITVYGTKFAISTYDDTASPDSIVTAAQAAERMLQIEGVAASFALIAIDNAIHISARSDGSFNVSLVLERIGGGGHFDSAGCKLTGITMKDALFKLKTAINEQCELLKATVKEG